MKELNFNKKSWHFILASADGDLKHEHETDLCSYTRHVLIGAFLVLLVASVFAFVAFVVVNMLFAIVFSVSYGTVIMTETAFAGWFASAVFTVWLSIQKSIEYLVAKRNRTVYDADHKPDAFVVNAYKGFKDRFCIKIKFKN